VVILSSNRQAVSVSGSPIVTTVGDRYVYEFRNNGNITF
jgi:hypothetical protein